MVRGLGLRLPLSESIDLSTKGKVGGYLVLDEAIEGGNSCLGRTPCLVQPAEIFY